MQTSSASSGFARPYDYKLLSVRKYQRKNPNKEYIFGRRGVRCGD
jgi:hypothetical protein